MAASRRGSTNTDVDIAVNRAQLRSVLKRWSEQGWSSALVPTMGNLHPGHLELVRSANGAADRVVASIYVNPSQFGEGEDFEAYPRTLEADLERLRKANCDLAFVPDHQCMYPFGSDSMSLAAPDRLANALEGASRPGHFDGVVSVVARLFNLVAPDVAVFGEKDFQQLLIIRRLVEDMGYPLTILPVPTVREADGLAMSSRNSYLEPEARLRAARLSEVLQKAVNDAGRPEARFGSIEKSARKALEGYGFRVDYVVIRRATDLAAPERGDRDLRILAAVSCAGTRLIDNMPIA